MAVSDKTQLGVADETTYGTPVTVDTFYDFVSESMDWQQNRMESASLRAQRRHVASDNWALGEISVDGDVQMELRPKGVGFWLKHAIGPAVTSQPDNVGAPSVYLHTFTPANLPTGFTLQVGRPSISDTVHAFTFHGCKVNEWSIECSVGEFASATWTILGEDVDTATALATASYPTGNKPFTFVQGSASVAGTPVNVKSFSLSGSNNLTDDRYFLGSALRKEALENALREVTGELELEFSDLTEFNRFKDGDEVAVVLQFVGDVIEGGLNEQLVITMNVRYDGGMPTIGGPEIVPQTIPFKVVDDGTTSIKVELQNTDTTV